MIVSIPRTEKPEYQWGMRRIRHMHLAHLGRVWGPETQHACLPFRVLWLSDSQGRMLDCRGKNLGRVPQIVSYEASTMSGHSKWATIKHKKAATDAKRGRAFTKVIREITIASRVGGGDPNTNPRLRTAIAAAKNENMPNDNIERAIARGTGQLEGEQYEEVNFEGYGPGGVGMIVQVVTTNRNRIVSEIRHLMSKHGGNMAESGAVGWMFHRKGDIVVSKEQANEDKMLSIVLDAGAEDLRDDGSSWEVVTPPESFEAVREALLKAGIKPESAEVGWVPQNYVKLSGPQAAQMLRMVEALEEHDDVQHVFANFDIDEKEIQAVMAAG
jgi:YebC/PmpR family DNA-binding regulatory protein